MANREQWEEKSFQIFTDEDGVLRSGYYPTGEGTVSGNVQVDLVWGNFPMQPDDDRTDSYLYDSGYQNVGWSGTTLITSDTLRISDYYRDLNNLEYRVSSDHVRADIGYSNFPGYIPDYAGDDDSGLEAVVPNVVGLTYAEASYRLGLVNLDIRDNWHTLSIFGLESTGKTVRVYAYDTNAAGGGYPEAYTVGLKAGDNVWVDNSEYDFGQEYLTITKVNEDGENSWFEFETATAIDPALDTPAMGTVWAAGNTVNVIKMMRGWNQPGDIKDEGTNIYVRGLAQD